MLKSKGVWQPLVLATLLSAGFAVVWGIAGSWLVSISQNSARYDQDTLYILPDGTPVIGNGATYRDTAGNILHMDQPESWLASLYLFGDPNPPAYSLPANWGERLGAYYTYRPTNYWYFLPDDQPHGSAYLVGYESETNRRLGYLGTAGFRETEPPPEERFPFDGRRLGHYGIRFLLHSPQNNVRGNQTVFLQTDDDKVYQIDSRARTVKVLLKDQRIVATGLLYINAPQRGEGVRLAVRTADSVQQFSERGEPISKFTLPAELRGKDILFAGTIPGKAIAWTTLPRDTFGGGTEHQLVWFNEEGHISRREKVTLQGRSQEYIRLVAGAIVPAPALIGGFALAMPVGEWMEGRDSSLTKGLEDFWPALVLAIMVGAALAWCCHRREMRYAASGKERLVWVAFVFAFGLFGWIGYRYVRSWPALAVCPTCGAAAPRDRPLCAACQAEFPVPTLRGTEVFA